MTPVPSGHAVWVAQDLLGPEQVLRFVTTGGEPLTLVSNLPYELWLDGRFFGDGGHRCVAGEALGDLWPAAAGADEVLVRVHWVDPFQPGWTGRLVFTDPFVACLERSASAWTRAEREAGLRFGVRASGHLTRQTVHVSDELEALTVSPVDRPTWTVEVAPICASSYHEIALEPLADRTLPAVGDASFEALCERAGGDPPECLVAWATEHRAAVRCRTYDLGAIALHRFELDTLAGPALLCGSEVAELERLTTEGRGRVALGDAVAGGLRGVGLIGQRGCRYVHLFCGPEDEPTLQAWRREYPFQWREVGAAPEDAALVEAARNNLIACVDGGIVDSCWRERVQWTGDARMGAIALRALADNPEVIELALRQIADSYDEEAGMVNGAWPSSMNAVLPTYHLAFCLAALEHDPELDGDPRVRHAVLHSLERWRGAYIRAGLLTIPPGWTFTDWEHGQLETMGYALPERVPHAVLNAWWVQVCERLSQPSGIDPEAFEATLGHGDGYLLVPADSRSLQRRLAQQGGRLSDAAYANLPEAAAVISPHATAVAVASGLAQGRRRDEALAWLESCWRSGELRPRMTPYFGYFVAEAFATESRELAVEFVRDFYGEEAARLGTISEKGEDQDSLAHGWSVAYVRFLLS